MRIAPDLRASDALWASTRVHRSRRFRRLGLGTRDPYLNTFQKRKSSGSAQSSDKLPSHDGIWLPFAKGK